MAVANSGASLTSVSTKQAGSAITFTSVCKQHGMQVAVASYSGGGSVLVTLEVSMDNTNWTQVAQVIITSTGQHYVSNGPPLPALYARANLVSIAPGTTVTLSATLACE